MIYKSLIRPILFSFDPELVHDFAVSTLSSLQMFLKWVLFDCDRSTSVRIAGIEFPNRIGLAAGMDKNCSALLAWQFFGFGFCEVGTITYHPQIGNPRTRLFRLVEQESLINRFGFNNSGAMAIGKKLASFETEKKYLKIPIGINIGKSRIVDANNEYAVIEDYLNSVKELQLYADYIAINVSSPNTPDLRSWQSVDRLTKLLSSIRQKTKKPLFLKIGPDLEEEGIHGILEVVENTRMQGIIATNTTNSRNNCPLWSMKEDGGLSGLLLRDRSIEVLKILSRYKAKETSIISVGGIGSVDDVQQRLDLGADLVQIYTAFIYEGPFFIKKLINSL